MRRIDLDALEIDLDAVGIELDASLCIFIMCSLGYMVKCIYEMNRYIPRAI